MEELTIGFPIGSFFSICSLIRLVFQSSARQKEGVRQFSLFVLVIATAGFLCNCSTVSTRIDERPGVFQSLTKDDQRLILAGRIATGMSEDAVYFAWGKPSYNFQSVRDGIIITSWEYVGGAAGAMPDYVPVRQFVGSRYGVQWIYKPLFPRSSYRFRIVDFRNGHVTEWAYTPVAQQSANK